MSTSPIGDALYAFPGGLHLKHNKQIACQELPEPLPLSDRYFLPIVDRQGNALQLIVEEGMTVRRGQPLTEARHDFEIVVHAPTSGQIGPVVTRTRAWPPNSRVECLTLIADGADQSVEPHPLTAWTECDRDQLVDHLRQAGLAGLGGAIFPTAAKLRGDWAPIQTLILNGAECEPWIACDEMLMRMRAADIVTGGQILARAAGAEDVVIAIEDQMGEASQYLSEAIEQQALPMPVRLRLVNKIYPEGGERQLIQVLTGQEVPHNGLPQDLGVLCHNVATAAAAFDAVTHGKALTERVVTVTGPGVNSPRNVIARIGTPMAELLEAAGGLKESAGRLILGGPMSGTALERSDSPVSKGTNCLLVLEADQIERPQPVMPCINCGECVRVCPATLLPQQLFKMIEAGRHETAAELNLFDCIECGCCAQVCPSHIPLVDWYRHGKAERQIEQLDQRRAALAKRRHEAREQRLEQQRLAREARREKRRQKLAEGEQAQNEIQAAIARARKKKEN
ncbi:MAG: electron transport complex subunit RsxC [Pseudomonadota bacterium]